MADFRFLRTHFFLVHPVDTWPVMQGAIVQGRLQQSSPESQWSPAQQRCITYRSVCGVLLTPAAVVRHAAVLAAHQRPLAVVVAVAVSPALVSGGCIT